jgi:hypothetical protein
MRKQQMCKILEIAEEDAYWPEREGLVGKVGLFNYDKTKDWQYGDFVFAESDANCPLGSAYFLKVRVEPLEGGGE